MGADADKIFGRVLQRKQFGFLKMLWDDTKYKEIIC